MALAAIIYFSDFIFNYSNNNTAINFCLTFSVNLCNRKFTINEQDMATHKRTQFTEAEQQLATIAKALGHPARVAILRLLAQRQACVCGELVTELPLAQSTVSQHLKELKAAGLVQGEIDGPRVCYCLDPTGWARARQLLGDLLTEIPAPAARPCC